MTLELQINHAYADEEQNVWWVYRKNEELFWAYPFIAKKFDETIQGNYDSVGGVNPIMQKQNKRHGIKLLNLIKDLGESHSLEQAIALQNDMRTIAGGGWRELLHDGIYKTKSGKIIHITKPCTWPKSLEMFLGASHICDNEISMKEYNTKGQVYYSNYEKEITYKIWNCTEYLGQRDDYIKGLEAR